MLAACGFEAPDVESSEQPSVQAADFVVGAIHIGDTSITAVSSDATTPASYLIATLVNDSKTTDTLTAIKTTNGTLTLSGSGTAGGQLTLPPGVPVQIEAPPLSSPGPIVTIATSPLPQAGGFLPVTFDFTNAGPSAVIDVPVVPPGETTAATQPVPTATASVPTEVGQTASD
jgi:hypothetical protein